MDEEDCTVALILPKMPMIDGRLISRHGEVSGVVQLGICYDSYYVWPDLTFHTQLLIFRNTNFNYLKYYNSGRETDTYMKFATIL